MSMRSRIAMSAGELRRFLAEEHSLTCATIGPGGRPHLVELWYVSDGDQLLCWSYASAQKVRNLERDPRATLQIEAGDRYDELRGVMLECDVEIERDRRRVAGVGLALAVNHPGAPGAETTAAIARQAPKRVALRFTPTRTASWDHRKLAG